MQRVLVGAVAATPAAADPTMLLAAVEAPGAVTDPGKLFLLFPLTCIVSPLPSSIVIRSCCACNGGINICSVGRDLTLSTTWN